MQGKKLPPKVSTRISEIPNNSNEKDQARKEYQVTRESGVKRFYNRVCTMKENTGLDRIISSNHSQSNRPITPQETTRNSNQTTLREVTNTDCERVIRTPFLHLTTCTFYFGSDYTSIYTKADPIPSIEDKYTIISTQSVLSVHEFQYKSQTIRELDFTEEFMSEPSLFVSKSKRAAGPFISSKKNTYNYIVQTTPEVSYIMEIEKASIRESRFFIDSEIGTTGKGTVVNSFDHSVYRGSIKGGAMHGSGVMERNDGYIYRGEWKDGKIEGRGSEKRGGVVYVGDMIDGAREGIGCMVDDVSGERYVGGWRSGFKHGVGKHSAGYEEYIGEWKEGARHGVGIVKDYMNCKGYMSYWNSNRSSDYKFTFVVVENSIFITDMYGTEGGSPVLPFSTQNRSLPELTEAFVRSFNTKCDGEIQRVEKDLHGYIHLITSDDSVVEILPKYLDMMKSTLDGMLDRYKRRIEAIGDDFIEVYSPKGHGILSHLLDIWKDRNQKAAQSASKEGKHQRIMYTPPKQNNTPLRGGLSYNQENAEGNRSPERQTGGNYLQATQSPNMKFVDTNDFFPPFEIQVVQLENKKNESGRKPPYSMRSDIAKPYSTIFGGVLSSKPDSISFEKIECPPSHHESNTIDEIEKPVVSNKGINVKGVDDLYELYGVSNNNSNRQIERDDICIEYANKYEGEKVDECDHSEKDYDMNDEDAGKESNGKLRIEMNKGESDGKEDKEKKNLDLVLGSNTNEENKNSQGAKDESESLNDRRSKQEDKDLEIVKQIESPSKELNISPTKSRKVYYSEGTSKKKLKGNLSKLDSLNESEIEAGGKQVPIEVSKYVMNNKMRDDFHLQKSMISNDGVNLLKIIIGIDERSLEHSERSINGNNGDHRTIGKHTDSLVRRKRSLSDMSSKFSAKRVDKIDIMSDRIEEEKEEKDSGSKRRDLNINGEDASVRRSEEVVSDVWKRIDWIASTPMMRDIKIRGRSG